MPDAHFIVLEGGEGAGKTSALSTLAATLQKQGHDVLQTREPGGTPEGTALRALLLAADAPAWDKYAELLLITAARIQHVRRVIEPALLARKTILCDRYLGSTLAYQGAGRGISPDFIMDLHNRAVGGRQPDLTILLDIDPRIGLARSTSRLLQGKTDESRFENLDLAFHDRVRAAFFAQSRTTPTLIIDAAPPQAEVLARLEADLLAWLSA